MNAVCRPILFSGPMVRAILDDRKTETRRTSGLMQDATRYQRSLRGPMWWDAISDTSSGESAEFVRCPYGSPGDLLWVRETWAGAADRPIHSMPATYFYRADGEQAGKQKSLSYIARERRWRPSIHMPRWASRITLRITDVRVKRLQDISRNDAIAEGLSWVGDGGTPYGIPGIASTWDKDPRECYRALWEIINGHGSWATNPWVWVISFERVEQAREAA